MSEPLIRPSRVKHHANIGDTVACLAGMKAYWEKTGRQIIWCQHLNVPADYYIGAIHPTMDDYGEGRMVMCNQKMYDMVKPLLLAQPYIKDVEVFNGQPINFDLDVIRKQIFTNIPHQAIQQWIVMAYPDLAFDLSKPWLNVPEDVDISTCKISYKSLLTSFLDLPELKNMVVLNFTERYRNPHLNYFFLKKYQSQLLFAGTEREHTMFCEKAELDIPRIIVDDFLQLAFILKKVKFLFANQSFCWNVQEAQKMPRLLEICEYADNCQAFVGENSYGHLHQPGIQYYFKELMKINK